ncbi:MULTISPECIES: site-specific DNA-methyltransferase [unclassified Cryobacterium]|uniref:site-specific DNA-methyltransferase n=1 Tax=unclassified Cryobacterium TaxID=2649013 RepID=UPI002AB586B6|nr:MULTISPECIES: DNA methyltransferase [unclassified Cryobacterium]MDY7529226.1 DNA methyltransferase [Cryobacterium sp. 10C2]MDY7558613.1 DNA methyltransferase [Cryobacterium sp. 10C3]MEB0202579.1 DNA methyltransferase [Cryobacterium sp. 5I3]MEB0289703.1 DNA methyltransferase [Cryobacterium sp. 10C2]MEB0304505.1 DNA methyltransferase [Cryobacterium sp. 10I1]
MSRLTDLLRAAKQLDPQLGADLEEELKPLQKRLPFGLNFERHAPEAVELAGHKIRKTSKVRVLPPRGSTARGDQRLWRVESISGDIAEISLFDAAEPENTTVPVDDLVLVAEFRDRIYPGLRPDGTVERGGDKPFHTVINGENFHVLEQLTFTHEHAVDAIYIDPPYNSGSRDWKYNNDYVEGDDLYRHSKWLAFMERRLRIAKRLLKPEDSVLIVTIDEKEYLRLGLLLEQTFPEARITMVTSSINGAGSTRSGTFNRSAEYLYFVQFGASAPVALPLAEEWNPVATRNKNDIRWNLLMRSGTQPFRTTHPNLFYPVYVTNTDDGPVFDSVGEPFYGEGWKEQASPDGTTAVWPIRRDGREGRWQISPTALRELIGSGSARLGRWNDSRTTPYYLKQGERTKVADGTFKISGRRTDGSIITDSSDYLARFVPTDVWRISSHDAGNSGSRLISTLMPDRKFPYPKSLYAVEDALRFFVSDNPSAIILDFFAGSGTTAHAVMRLNKQDGGTRQCISVTNNEVSAEEQAKLREGSLRAGDPDWETWGICDYITKPRIRAAITGLAPDDVPIKGDYKFVDEFPMSDGFDENAAFFTLTYESPWMVSNDRAFAAIAPMLWLRAGAQGSRIDSLDDGWTIAETYGVLKDLDRSSEFVAALKTVENLRIAYIVTDDEGRYQQVANELRGIETVRLYEDYLRNCESTGDY